MEILVWDRSSTDYLISSEGHCWNEVTHLIYALTTTFVYVIQGDLCL